MEIPPFDTALNFDDLRAMSWEKDQMIALQKKRIEQLEAIIAAFKEPLDAVADADLTRLDGVKAK